MLAKNYFQKGKIRISQRVVEEISSNISFNLMGRCYNCPFWNYGSTTMVSHFSLSFIIFNCVNFTKFGKSSIAAGFSSTICACTLIPTYPIEYVKSPYVNEHLFSIILSIIIVKGWGNLSNIRPGIVWKKIRVSNKKTFLQHFHLFRVKTSHNFHTIQVVFTSSINEHVHLNEFMISVDNIWSYIVQPEKPWIWALTNLSSARFAMCVFRKRWNSVPCRKRYPARYRPTCCLGRNIEMNIYDFFFGKCSIRKRLNLCIRKYICEYLYKYRQRHKDTHGEYPHIRKYYQYWK